MEFIKTKFKKAFDPSKDEVVQEVVENTAKKRKWIVHGARAVNAQLPPELHRHTEDWDFFAKKPKKASQHLEKRLETTLNKDVFQQATIQLGGSKQTVYRVVSKETGEEVADFMKTPNHENLYTIISGIRYETLAHAKMMYQKILSNPVLMKRWGKTKRDLDRIITFERKLKGHYVREQDVPEPFIMVKARPMLG